MTSFTPRTMDELRETWPEQIDHVSASSLKMLARCPEQYRQRYILGRKVPPAAVTVWGNADHAAIAWNYAEKLRTGNDQGVGDVMDMFVTALDERIEEAGGANEVDWEDETRDGVIKKGQQLVGLYRETVAPFVMPEQVERSFELTEGMPVPVIGYIDLVAHDFNQQLDEIEPNTRRMIERKAQGRVVREPNPDWQFQRRVYQLAEEVPLEWQVSVRTKTPRIQMHGDLIGEKNPKPVQLVFPPDHLESTRRSVEQSVAYIAHLYQTYGPEEPWPAVAGITHPWACNFCGYRPQCTYWAT